ncbi:MAG: hypothetical protein ICV74_04590 [Thermoleophilia bacterium]|nr:hypothetical protein [Thermoleophilia bacterium]
MPELRPPAVEMASHKSIEIEKPLRLGEIFAQAVRVYGERFWAALGIGAVVAAAFVAGGYLHPAAAIVLLSLVFTGAWAAATRVVAGDAFRDAWARVALHVAPLLVFTVVASLPFALAVSQLYLILFAVAWLALTGFAIPVIVSEPASAGESSLLQRLGFGLTRSLELARAEYFHAAGVIAALVVVYVLIGLLLTITLAGFADNTAGAAAALVQLVMAPFFFLGLAILYFEQRTRAISSRPRR